MDVRTALTARTSACTWDATGHRGVLASSPASEKSFLCVTLEIVTACLRCRT
jgi:hypothetical protein